LQSRSIVVVLQRALADEEHEPLETRLTPELVGVRRELAAWSATAPTLPMPSRSEMPPEVYNRDSDNWRPMFAIARLAEGEWPARIREASLKAIKTETLPPLIVSLLSSVGRTFGDNPKPNTWLDTLELAARLNAQEGEPWGKINRGGPIDPYWLRTKFVNLLDPPGAQDWWQTIEGGKQRHRSGYFYGQFSGALRRLPEPPAGVYDPTGIHPEEDPKTAGVSGVAGGRPENPKKSATSFTPDQPPLHPITPDPPSDHTSATPDAHPIHKADQVYKKSSKSAADEALTPHTPDTPGDSTPSWGCVPELGESAVARGPQPPTEEPAKVAEDLDPELPKKARRRAKKPPAPQLDLPEPPLAAYSEGSIAIEIRQLHAANPERSVSWIAKKSGQPPSLVREVLGDDGISTP
jgi:hypothetical protein